MKRILLMAALAGCGTAQAQNDVQLQEVTVKGARTVVQPDGRWIFPTREQLESSTDGYSLLAKLALPHIRVDEALHTITALTSTGSVQLRVNDVEVNREELLALDLEGIERIEFIDSPGVRYGDDVAYIINIRVRKPTGGYALGTSLTNTLTAVNGGETVYGKVNRGRSELAASYALDYQRLTGGEYDERASYTLEDGSGIVLNRHQLEGRNKSLEHRAQLTYSLSDSAYVLQARLSGSRDIRPNRSVATFQTANQQYTDRASSRSSSPTLDLYYHQDYGRHQSLTANVVGSAISSHGTIESNEGTPYVYATRGHTYTLWSEALYENRLRPLALSVGLQQAQRYSHNEYRGDTEATNRMRTSLTYGFAQVVGKKRHLGYMGGLGLSRHYYRQGTESQEFWLLRPKASLSYRLAPRLTAKYDFELTQHTSQIALVSDVSIKQNAMETLVGNPTLKPARRTSHDLRLSYATPRLTSELQGYYRLNSHANMEQYLRQGGHFYKTQNNDGRACNMFFLQSYNQWEAVPQHLTATVYGGLYRFFNYGPDYTHTYTAFNGGLSVQAYLGRWTLGAYADNGWNFMEGEHRGHQAPAWYFTATCQVNGSLRLSLYAQHPFAQHPLMSRTEIESRYLHKDISQHQRDFGNMLTLNLTWRLDHGRRYRDIQRTMEHQEQETGILK